MIRNAALSIFRLGSGTRSRANCRVRHVRQHLAGLKHNSRVAEPTILFAPMLEAEVRAIADELRPAGFAFRNVSHAELPDALGDADYLCGFIGPIATDVLVNAAAGRLKLVQLMSAGYDRFNLDGARAARLPVAVNGGANAISVAEHAVMLMLMA